MAIEFDWCRKWAEAIGQALYYSRMTGKAPAAALICSPEESRFIARYRAVDHTQIAVGVWKPIGNFLETRFSDTKKAPVSA